MKIAICNETFPDWPFQEVCEFAAELGYDGIEIAPFTMAASAFDFSDVQCRQIRKEADRYQLQIAGFHWLLAETRSLHLTSPDADVRMETARYLTRLASRCAITGAGIMVLGSPRQRNRLPGVSVDQAHEFAADCLRQVVPELAASDVVLALEPLGPEEGDFLLTAAETRRLIDHIDSPHVRLNLDVKAMSTEPGTLSRIIYDNRDLLVHFHCNDPNRRGPGMGAVDYRPILATLDEVGYDGWYSVEVFDRSTTPEDLARTSIEYLRGLRV